MKRMLIAYFNFFLLTMKISIKNHYPELKSVTPWLPESRLFRHRLAERISGSVRVLRTQSRVVERHLGLGKLVNASKHAGHNVWMLCANVVAFGGVVLRGGV